jgi:hypothetical protein
MSAACVHVLHCKLSMAKCKSKIEQPRLLTPICNLRSFARGHWPRWLIGPDNRLLSDGTIASTAPKGDASASERRLARVACKYSDLGGIPTLAAGMSSRASFARWARKRGHSARAPVQLLAGNLIPACIEMPGIPWQCEKPADAVEDHRVAENRPIIGRFIPSRKDAKSPSAV